MDQIVMEENRAIEQMIDNLFNFDDDIYRESFDRFRDDLCEVIVSYLSFEDKVSFECVSKQFQRCIYNKQYSIELIRGFIPTVCMKSDKQLEKYKPESEDVRFPLTKYSHRVMKTLKKNPQKMDTKGFEIILQKCQFLNKILIVDNYFKNRDEILQLIIRYCNFVNDIAFCFEAIPEKTLIEFGEKFGPNLKAIRFFAPIVQSNKTLLRYCPNLETINWTRVQDITDSNEILVPKVSEVGFYEINDIKLIEIFANNHKRTIKRLRINCYDDHNKDSLDTLFKSISSFENLEHLKLYFSTNNGFSEAVEQNMRNIALKCKKLSYLSITLSKGKFAIYFINSLQYFVQLKNLNFLCYFGGEEVPKTSIKVNHFPKLLTHFKLHYPKIDDNFFEDIQLFLPQLQYLEISVENMTDTAMNSLAKLKNIKFLRINSNTLNKKYFTSLTVEGMSHVIDNCLKLESIVFSDFRLVPEQCVKALEFKYKKYEIFGKKDRRNSEYMNLWVKLH